MTDVPKIRQVDYMRELVSKIGANKDAVCAKYAKAEDDGIVSRVKNKHRLTSIQYAERLFNDGLRKGWFKSVRNNLPC